MSEFTENKSLIDDYIKEFDGNDKIDIATIYDAVASNYDTVMKVVRDDTCADQLVTICCRYLDINNFKDQRIIDFGCGTGLLGEKFVQNKCSFIHGLDISKKMLKIAEERKIYSHLFHEALTVNPSRNLKGNYYDIAISGGCFIGKSHIPLEAVREMIRVVRVGGLVTFTLTDPNYETRYMNMFGKLIEEKLIEIRCMEYVPYKFDHVTGESSKAYVICLQVM